MRFMKTNRPFVRITDKAKAHLEKTVRVLKKQGRSVSETSLVSELILSYSEPAKKAHFVGGSGPVEIPQGSQPVKVQAKVGSLELTVEGEG